MHGYVSHRLFLGTLWLVGTVFIWFWGRESREPSLAGKKQAWSPKDLDVQSLQTAFASEQAAPVLCHISLQFYGEEEKENFSHGCLCIDVKD